MALSTGKLLVISQVPTHVMTNTSANATNPFPMITSTNQGASGHLTHHEWMWFQLQGQRGGSLGPAQTECWSIALVEHQELGVRIQQLSYHDVLIEFDREVDVRWVAQKLLRMEWWMGALCYLECNPCGDEEGLQQFGWMGDSMGGSGMGRSIKVWSNNPHGTCSWAPAS